MPENLTFGEAAALPVGGMTALQLLRSANAGAGKKVLIYGASGSVGTYAVQIARHLGAEVTGVCSTANLELVRSLGASKVIDYTREDFTQNGETYDIIFDAVGKITQGKMEEVVENSRVFMFRSPLQQRRSRKIWNTSSSLAEAGELKPVIDREYSLEQVPEAHRYVETGRKRGNVVVMVS